MIVGEVCLQTNDVIRLAGFYRKLLGIENESNDEVHQVIIAEAQTWKSKHLPPTCATTGCIFLTARRSATTRGKVKETLVWQKMIEFSGAYNEDGYVMRQHEI